ncbi:MAG: cytoplasmic protein [Nitrospinota bacterium]|nr:cytoplasmic protein [Nitrospinota bacterium]
MATRASDLARPFELGDINELPVLATDIIYEGSAVGDNGSGYARPLVAGDPFRGFAERKVDNSTGAAGDKNIRVLTRGLVQLSIGSLAITDVGKDVYASDDDTFTLTQGSNTRIGYVYRFVSSGVGIVAFSANSGVEAELTDSTTGTADGTVADVGGAFSQATLNNNFADIIAKVNYLLRRIGQ